MKKQEEEGYLKNKNKNKLWKVTERENSLEGIRKGKRKRFGSTKSEVRGRTRSGLLCKVKFYRGPFLNYYFFFF